MAILQQGHKRWGRVSAQPSEYLIQLRRGRVVKHGPGLSVWIWPRDSVTILPTSIQRLRFVADQVTSEKVGVEITGVAVYRIADPLLAYRMLDFTCGQQALDELSAVLCDMFIGAARRLVANMTVQSCMTRRKENIAEELMREIAPVISGSGRAEDVTDQGWGLLIDTIEIQDVRILSERVFADLQAPYRAELQLRARQAEVAREEQVHQREVQAKQASLAANLELSRREAEAEERARLAKLGRDERVRLAEIEGKRRTADAALQGELEEQQRKQEIAAVAHQRQLQALEQRATEARAEAEAHQALAEQQAQSEARLVEAKVAMDRLRGEQELALDGRRQELHNQVSEERLRHDFVTRALPALATAMAKNTGQVQLVQIQRGEGAAAGGGFFVDSLAQLLALGKSAGLDFSSLGAGGDDREGRTSPRRGSGRSSGSCARPKS